MNERTSRSGRRELALTSAIRPLAPSLAVRAAHGQGDLELVAGTGLHCSKD